MPEEISATTIFRILDYIGHEIPAILISKPLLQRHHFLGLTPSDSEYLVWPSEKQSHVLDLLNSQPLPSSCQELPELLPVHYTADKEHVQAHVRITTDLRLVFLWDNDNNDWRYHNLDTMPFPITSYPNFRDAAAIYSPDDFIQEPSYEIKVSADADGDEEDDSYWNAYSQGDEQDPSAHLTTAKSRDDANSEDAYWARYSTVQGSADSTIPSPLPVHRKPPQASDESNHLPERIIVPPDDFSAHHAEAYNPLEPPSPEALSRRLEELSALMVPQPSQTPSRDPGSPTLFDESPATSDSDDTASLRLNISSTEASPLDDVQTEPDMEGLSTKPVADEFIVVDTVENINQDQEEQAQDPSERVLRDGIRNLFELWRLGRADKSVEADRDAFLRNVRRALEGL